MGLVDRPYFFFSPQQHCFSLSRVAIRLGCVSGQQLCMQCRRDTRSKIDPSEDRTGWRWWVECFWGTPMFCLPPFHLIGGDESSRCRVEQRVE